MSAILVSPPDIGTNVHLLLQGKDDHGTWEFPKTNGPNIDSKIVRILLQERQEMDPQSTETAT